MSKDNVEAAIMFSHHIGDELTKKLRDKGYHGNIITPI